MPKALTGGNQINSREYPRFSVAIFLRLTEKKLVKLYAYAGVHPRIGG